MPSSSRRVGASKSGESAVGQGGRSQAAHSDLIQDGSYRADEKMWFFDEVGYQRRVEAR